MTGNIIGFRQSASLTGAVLLTIVLASASCGGGSAAAPDAGKPGGGAGTTGSGAAGTSGPTGGAGVAGTGTPAQLCKQFVSVLCSRLDVCNQLDASAQDETDCNTLENVDFGCDRATAAGFTECLQDVNALSCTSLFPQGQPTTPGSCDAPLGAIPLSTAQMQCADLAGTLCNKIAACDGVTAPTADDLLACQEGVYGQIGCGYAVSVGAMYAKCLQDIPNAPCVQIVGGDGGASDDAGDMGVPSCNMVIAGPLAP